MAALVALAEVNAELQVRKRAAFGGRDQFHVLHIGIEQHLRLMGLLQPLFRLFEPQVVGVVDVEVQVPHREGLLRALGFAPAFNGQGIHLTTS
ncbi:hypothetical protein D9M73_259130 [compost metagenome]